MTDSLRTRIAAALFNVDNGGIVAYLDVDEPDLMDTDRVIDGTINFAKLADAVIRELEADVMADDYVPPCCRPGGRCNR